MLSEAWIWQRVGPWGPERERCCAGGPAIAAQAGQLLQKKARLLPFPSAFRHSKAKNVKRRGRGREAKHFRSTACVMRSRAVKRAVKSTRQRPFHHPPSSVRLFLPHRQDLFRPLSCSVLYQAKRLPTLATRPSRKAVAAALSRRGLVGSTSRAGSSSPSSSPWRPPPPAAPPAPPAAPSAATISTSLLPLLPPLPPPPAAAAAPFPSPFPAPPPAPAPGRSTSTPLLPALREAGREPVAGGEGRRGSAGRARGGVGWLGAG